MNIPDWAIFPICFGVAIVFMLLVPIALHYYSEWFTYWLPLHPALR